MTSTREAIKAVTSQSWLKPFLKALGTARCRAWDLVHGVDTCGEIPLLDLNFESQHKLPGLEYQSHHPAIIRAQIEAVPVRHENYIFVDFGCGKGRVLLVAAEFPFRQVVGIEFAPQLAEIAQNNLKTYRGGRSRCREISVLAMDATAYELPTEPAVLFFYSPFTGAVMEKVIENIESSLQRTPRELFVLFTGREIMRDRAFGSRPQYRRLKRERYFDLYQHVL